MLHLKHSRIEQSRLYFYITGVPLSRKDSTFLYGFFWIQLIGLAGYLLAAAAFLTGFVGPIWLAISLTSASMLFLLLVAPLALFCAGSWFNGLHFLAIPVGLVAIGIPGVLASANWFAWVGVATFAAFGITQRYVPHLKKNLSRQLSAHPDD